MKKLRLKQKCVNNFRKVIKWIRWFTAFIFSLLFHGASSVKWCNHSIIVVEKQQVIISCGSFNKRGKSLLCCCKWNQQKIEIRLIHILVVKDILSISFTYMIANFLWYKWNFPSKAARQYKSHEWRILSACHFRIWGEF